MMIILLGAGLLALLAGGVIFVLRNHATTAERTASQENLTRWIAAETLPTEVIAAQPAWLNNTAGRPQLTLPANPDAAGLLHTLRQAAPDYCLALNSLPWQGVQSSPWFQEHYREVYRVGAPDDPAAPLTLYRYVASPFEAGETVTATLPFTLAEGQTFALTGYRLESRRLTPGAPFHLTLFWRSDTALHEPLLLVLRLLDPATGRVLQRTENALPGGLSTEYWNPGTQLADRYLLAPPLELKAGSYPVEITFYRRNGAPLAPPQVIATLPVPPAVSPQPPTPDYPLAFMLDNGIALVGYDAPARVTTGETVTARVALYWHATQPVTGDYKVFVHFLTADDVALAQDDSQPVVWTYPTTRWQAGEYIRDEHALVLPPTFPRGDYRIAIGMYDPATNARLAVRDTAGNELPDHRVILHPLSVR